MWWAGKRDEATVYLGQAEIRLAHGGEQRLVAGAMPLAEAVPLLQEVLKPLGRVRLRVLVSGGWCQPFLLPAVDGVNSDAEWLQVAAGLLQDMTGMPASSRLWLDREQGTPPLAVALHPDVDELLKALAANGRVQEVRPWWAAVLSAHIQGADGLKAGGTAGMRIGTGAAAVTSNSARSSIDPTKGIAVVDSDAVTLLLAEGNRYEVAQSYGLMGEPASSVLARALISQGRHVGEVAVKRMLDASTAIATSTATAPAPSSINSVPFLEIAA